MLVVVPLAETEWRGDDDGGAGGVGNEAGGGRLVTRAKKRRSAFRGGQGRVPWRPMPKVGVVATIRVSGGRGRGGGIVVGEDVLVVVEVKGGTEDGGAPGMVVG